MTLLAPLLLALQFAVAGPPTRVAPVLAFPEPGLDDPAAYQGYRTRFYRDAAGNAFQVYVDGRSGRVVNLWADAADESLGFTARDSAGHPVALAWGGDSAEVATGDGMRSVAYTLETPGTTTRVGIFQLGSMRVERDLQYAGAQLRPFGAPPFRAAEMERLVDDVARLAPAERARHLALLGAADVAALRARLDPTVSRPVPGSVRIDHVSLDGHNHLRLEFSVDPGEATLEVTEGVVSVHPRAGRPVRLRVEAATDATALTPLSREQIFDPAFLDFYGRIRAARDSAVRAGAQDTDPRVMRFRWIEREMRGVELVGYREKLMAGLPNYATYFGRDDMLSALLMEPVWTPAMQEAVIAAVLRKLSPTGEVSHEESLGEQAIRENAADYHALVARALDARSRGDAAAADSALAAARALLADLQRTRENYRMVDDEFQLPVLAARYLADPDVAPERKRAFLEAAATPDSTESRLSRLLRELDFVARATAPYVRDPVATNMVSFPRAADGHWISASWRDSGAGYAGGRFAMDVNAVWVPEALRGVRGILAALRELGLDRDALLRASPALRGSALDTYAGDAAALDHAIAVWDSAGRHFRVALATDGARARVRARLAAMPAAERDYWSRVADTVSIPRDSIRFSALSLDGDGRPIPVVSTDPGMRLLLGDATDAVASGAESADAALRDLRAILLPYPFGLFVPGLGPLVANDAYAAPAVWKAWETDLYHSPMVVWGREVNVLLSGLARQLDAAYGPDCRPKSAALAGYARELRDAMDRIGRAVEASGLQHNELWSYGIEDGRLLPKRYETSTDVQLWNLTDLAVQFRLARTPACDAGH